MPDARRTSAPDDPISADDGRPVSRFDPTDVARLLTPPIGFLADAQLRYRATCPPTRHPAPGEAASGTSDMVSILVDFQRSLLRITSEDSQEVVGRILIDELAPILDLDLVGIWHLDWQKRLAREIIRHGDFPPELQPVIPFAQIETFIDVLARGECCLVPAEISQNAAGQIAGDRIPLGGAPALLVPVPPDDLPIAVFLGTRRNRDAGFSPADVQLARLLAYQIGILFRYESSTRRATRQNIQLEAMMEDFTGAVSVFDQAGTLTYVNDAEMELFDLDPDDCWQGQELQDFLRRKHRLSLTGEPVPLEENPIYRALQGDRVEGIHQIAERHDGSRRYITTTARPIYVDGELVGAVSTSRDLTAKRSDAEASEPYLRQLEHALRRSQAMAEIVVEINENGAQLDLDVISQFAIGRICAEFGANVGALWLKSDDGIFRSAATHGVDERVFALHALTDESFTFAGSAVSRNRPTMLRGADVVIPPEFRVPFNESSAVLVIPMIIRGERTGVAMLGFDHLRRLDESDVIFASVWGRQCAQAIESARLFKELETAHSRLVAVLNQLPQAVVIVDSDRRSVLGANQAANDLWGQTIPFGSNVFDLRLLNAEGSPLKGLAHPARQVLASLAPISGLPLIVSSPDGTRTEVIASYTPVLDGRGRPNGIVCVMQKRTDFKALDRSKDQFISVIAHELRNPLTSLRGNLQLLERRVRKRDDEIAADELARISTAITQADRVGDLVSRMLDVSRVDMGSLDVSPAPTDAIGIINEAVNGWTATDDGHTITVTAPPSLPVVWDAARILQVFNNLLQNADRYAHGTPVTITVTEEPNDLVRVVVRDEGPGLPADVQRRLFKQYYRFDDGSSEGRPEELADGKRGLGIGMYVSGRLIRQHGGSITAGNHPDGGALFTITLPTDATAHGGS